MGKVNESISTRMERIVFLNDNNLPDEESKRDKKNR